MRAKALYLAAGLLLLSLSLSAQDKTVFIQDGSGNQTTATISGENVFFHDNHGNSAQGIISGQNVFVSTSKGLVTFGTIVDGNVFLTDQKGNTTGTVRDGNIFLSNSDGSITTGSYDSNGNVFTSTSLSTQEQQRINQQNYEAGAALGRTIGGGINAAIDHHRMASYCKANPTSTLRLGDGIGMPCPGAPLHQAELDDVDRYCAENPGLNMYIGLHRFDCYTPPNPPNLKWAAWEMDQSNYAYKHPHNKTVIASGLDNAQLLPNWQYWRATYCSLASSGTKYKDLADKKQTCDYISLGDLYFISQGAPHDYALAASLYEKACDGGNMDGCEVLGYFYEKGQGVAQDYAAARTYYQKACDRGNMAGCVNLGTLFDKGRGLTQDFSLARSLYQKACGNGNMDGCEALGYLYDSGEGVPRNYAQARLLYQKACDGGEMAACDNLGYLCSMGRGAPSDNALARLLFQKACDNGNMAGCNNLGTLFNKGLGVAQDPAQARLFYGKACEGGIEGACTLLHGLK